MLAKNTPFYAIIAIGLIIATLDARATLPPTTHASTTAVRGVPSALKRTWKTTTIAFIGPLPVETQKQQITAMLLSTDEETALLPAVDQPDIRPHQRTISDNVLRALPAGCRDNLRHFYVDYEQPKQRGLGGKSTIIIDGGAGDEEFAALLTHECGHVIHGNLQGGVLGSASAFRDGKQVFNSDAPVVAFFSISWESENVMRQGMKKVDFASGYAQSDAFEDFAETFALYILHHDAFLERAADNVVLRRKLAWMEREFPSAKNALGGSAYHWDGIVPWDVTKLPYTLYFPHEPLSRADHPVAPL